MTNKKTNDTENVDIKEVVEEAKQELHARSSVQAQADIKDFVQDKFFEKGHLWLKVRQILLNVVFLAVLILPVMVLFNSLSDGKTWSFLYYWTYEDGFDLTNYLSSSILLAVVVVLVASLAFLLRNNYREQKVYPKKKTYNQELLNKRKEVLNELYTERFGDKTFRETAKYYEVDGEKNIDDHLIEKLFKDNEVEIK